MEAKEVVGTRKQEALDHYADMIKYAKKQEQDSKPGKWAMFGKIDTSWGAAYCSYCKFYRFESGNLDCNRCPLGGPNSEGGSTCCSGLWSEMAEAETWADWIIAAKKIVTYITKYG